MSEPNPYAAPKSDVEDVGPVRTGGMLKPVAIGALSGIATALVVGVIVGALFASHSQYVAVASNSQDVTIASEHDRLVNLWYLQPILIAGWTVGAMLGGYVSARRDRGNWTRISLFVGIAIVVIWGLPSILFGGANTSVTHLLSVFLLIPGSLLGGLLARNKKGARKKGVRLDW